jgi:Trk K+ transport system NAD-binding subunit
MRLVEVAVPQALWGLTLREADLRARRGIEVLYVLQGPQGVRKLADPEMRLEAGDRMVIMAEASRLLEFRESAAARAAP